MLAIEHFFFVDLPATKKYREKDELNFLNAKFNLETSRGKVHCLLDMPKIARQVRQSRVIHSVLNSFDRRGKSVRRALMGSKTNEEV